MTAVKIPDDVIADAACEAAVDAEDFALRCFLAAVFIKLEARGWKMTPVRATTDMLADALKAATAERRIRVDGESTPQTVWTAMWDVAPKLEA